jgi:chloramphenicol-sensitive protein RarD
MLSLSKHGGKQHTHMTTQEHPNETAGILFASGAYVLWGMFPLYWRLLDSVPPLEIATHRILWCALLVGAVTLWRGRIGGVWRIVRTKKLISALTVSSLLIAANWTIYIYSISMRDVVEAALGYFINPLLSILLGVVLLGERISKLRLAAVLLATVALIVKTVTIGHVPLIALGLALTFGFYGYIRKLTPVDAIDGMVVETGILFPFTLAAITLMALNGTGAFPKASLSTNALLIFGGAVTAVPLALFAAGARRMRLSTLGFVQYFSPTITLLVATLAFGEPFGRLDLIVFGCIWIALILVGLEKQFAGLKQV